MISDAIALVDFINKYRNQWNIKVAYFDGAGNKLRGDQDVSVRVQQSDTADKWFFEVTPLEGYEFLRYPVNPEGVVEELGKLRDGTYDSRYFRYIPVGRLSASGFANVRVPFVVYGYPIEALTSMGGPVGPPTSP